MSENIIEIYNLKKYFPIKLGLFKTLFSRKTPTVKAVDGVSFKIKAKEIFGLVGESGCGKTTTGRCILRLIEPTEGEVTFKGINILSLLPEDLRKLRRKLQIIFQDPYGSLNPRMTVYDIISEPIMLQKITEDPDEIIEMISKVLIAMGLTPPEEFLYRFPHELSGGQRQRVAIARAFVLEPEFIVADEPVSMLDASIRTEVLNLMLNLIKKTGCSVLYITHDLALARYVCDRIAVMYLGKIVEIGLVEKLILDPQHPYTKALLAAIPVPDPKARKTKILIKGEVPSSINPPSGCRLHPRCPYAMEICKVQEPKLTLLDKERMVACHLHSK